MAIFHHDWTSRLSNCEHPGCHRRWDATRFFSVPKRQNQTFQPKASMHCLWWSPTRNAPSKWRKGLRWSNMINKNSEGSWNPPKIDSKHFDLSWYEDVSEVPMQSLQSCKWSHAMRMLCSSFCHVPHAPFQPGLTSWTSWTPSSSNKNSSQVFWLARKVGNEGPSTFTAWYIGDETSLIPYLQKAS